MTTETPARTESAADRARRLWDGSFHGTAERLLRELLGADEEAIQVLLPWVTDRVRATMRNSVRHTEDEAFTSPSGRPDRVARFIRTQTGALPALDNLEQLLSMPVLVPRAGNGTQTVLWKDMTADDHRARIVMLRRPLEATLATISHHEWAIAEIARYKVGCLGDIDTALLKADILQARSHWATDSQRQ